MGEPSDQDFNRRVKEMEGKIMGWLNPNEPHVMRIQSLLVWEYPRRSAVLLFVVQLLFWFLSTTWLSSITLLSFVGMLAFIVDTWKKQIWPEIRVPPPVPEDTDGWTPVHPRLLSVPELAQEMAQITVWIQDQVVQWRKYRRDHPVRFFLFGTSFFLAMFMLGTYISGFTFCYGVVLGLLLWPGVAYHGLVDSALSRLEPHIMGPLRKLPFYRAPANNNGNNSSRMTEEEFYPEIDPAAVQALSKAVTDSEEEGVPTPSLSAGLSKEPSLADSEEDERRLEELTPGVDAMPSFDDIDHTDDELDAAPTMDFNPSHFGEGTDSSDEETISRDLSLGQAGAAASEALTGLTGSLVSQTLGAMMQSALQSVTGTSSSTDPRTGTRITYTRTAEGESVDFQQGPEAIPEVDEPEDTVDIDSEFDFLEDYDPSGEPRTKK